MSSSISGSDMKAIGTLMIAALAAIPVYLGAIYLFPKPLTLGFIHDAYTVKQDYARTAPSPALVIVAGSNGLMSHRCEAIEPITGLPCINAAIAAELGLGYGLEIAKRLIRPGDTVLMPLEYEDYRTGIANLQALQRHPYRVIYEPDTLGALSTKDTLQALTQFDFHYLLLAVAETMLDVAGVERRFNRNTLTRQGDMRGHNAKKAAIFRAAILKEQSFVPKENEFEFGAGSVQALNAFFDWAGRNNVRIIGTLPVNFEDSPLSEALVSRIEQFYKMRDQQFFVMENRSLYPRSCFYDTQYHLHEDCQIRHSRRLARALTPVLRDISYPPGKAAPANP